MHLCYYPLPSLPPSLPYPSIVVTSACHLTHPCEVVDKWTLRAILQSGVIWGDEGVRRHIKTRRGIKDLPGVQIPFRSTV